MLVISIFSFSHNVFKRFFFLRGVKSRHDMVKGSGKNNPHLRTMVIQDQTAQNLQSNLYQIKWYFFQRKEFWNRDFLWNITTYFGLEIVIYFFSSNFRVQAILPVNPFWIPVDRDRNKLRIINPFPNKPWFLRVCSISLYENTVGKGEIAQNEQFLLFFTVFTTHLENFFLRFSSNLKLSSANFFSLEASKICRLEKG